MIYVEKLRPSWAYFQPAEMAVINLSPPAPLPGPVLTHRRSSGDRAAGARPSGSVGTESRDHAREDFTTARKPTLA
jgi:hypothetical protein